MKFVAKEKGLIVSDTRFLTLVAEYSISDIQSADILVIPGSTISFIKELKKNSFGVDSKNSSVVISRPPKTKVAGNSSEPVFQLCGLVDGGM